MNIYNKWSAEYLQDFNIFIVGCGLSGSVIAQRIVEDFDCKVIIIEKRDHIGGNCYDYTDEETNILVNKYGPHIFHTRMAHVWKYVNRFEEFKRWDQQVLASVDGHLVPVPVNILTVNKLFNECIETEADMSEWLEKVQCKYEDSGGPGNSEEMCKSRVGEVLYDKMFKPYTYKQWNKYPAELKPEILARIPVRNNCDPRYYNDKYQALPKEGYTKFFEKLLANPNIHVVLNTDFMQLKNDIMEKNPKLVIFTGPIDYYYNAVGYDKLEYRSLYFEYERHYNMNYYQPTAVVNYPSEDIPYTRITEYKHFLNRKSAHTIIAKEYSTDKGDPYYPVQTDANIALYNKYKQMAEKEEDIMFVGRLANYKYFNMDQAIDNALKVYDTQVKERIEKIQSLSNKIWKDASSIGEGMTGMCSQS